MQEKIIWIGKYQEDFLFFKVWGSVSKFGIEKKNHFVFDSKAGNSYETYILEKIKYFVSSYPDAKFYFYDQFLAHKIKRYINISEKLICINRENILLWLNNKSIAREWIRNIVNTPETVVLSHDEVKVNHLKNVFWGHKKFVAQNMVSSGGHKTFVIDDKCKNQLENDLYIVSPYYEPSISVNVTALIFEKQFVMFPFSVQIIEEKNGKLLYKGSDFLSIKLVPQQLLEKLHNATKKILHNLMFLKYRGICGIDFLLYNDKVFFLEINPRFQGSSFLIDKALQKEGLSLYQLNMDSFCNSFNPSDLQYLSRIKIPYGFTKDETGRNITHAEIINKYPDTLSTEYYNYFADKYHIMLKNWTAKIDTQGKILKQIFENYSKIPIVNILDCTCGIGIQAISLAQEGYCVTGSDLSQNELEIAREEARKRNLNIQFVQEDCRYLESSFKDKFDAIISIDSALPHLLTEENFLLAFASIYECLNYGGIFISSYRDYEELLKTKPNMAYPVRFNNENGIEYTILRKWNWDGELIASKQYVIADYPSGSKLYTSSYMQWAVTKTKLIELAAQTRFSECYWLLPEDSGFTQPILCLIK